MQTNCNIRPYTPSNQNLQVSSPSSLARRDANQNYRFDVEMEEGLSDQLPLSIRQQKPTIRE
jgi:hypothetical protein